MTPGTHTCPGYCGKQVCAVFACTTCTARLPPALRTAIVTTWWAADWPAHSRAMSNAMHFYATEPAWRRGPIDDGGGQPC